MGLSQPLVSWHLGRLRLAGIVQTRRSGRETVCTLRPEVFQDVSARERILFGLEGWQPATPAADLEPAEGQA